MYSIQIIDDDKNVLSALGDFFKEELYEVFQYESGEMALENLNQDLPNVILLDLKLPGLDGFSILEEIKKQNPEIQVIIITGTVDINTAVKAMKMGAMDYVTKPFNLDEVSVLVEKAVQTQQSFEHLALLRKKQEHSFSDIIGSSGTMKDVFSTIQQISLSSRTSVLITGETGTGKELVARAIHHSSDRSQKPFVEVNCSAFNENLLESELFGYEPGAFTGARTRKKGLLEMAHGGTFFLDEIGEMELSLQSKILKVIEEKSLRRIGGVKEINIDTRIISATSKDLIDEVANNNFRKDLFYRLNVARVELPPLKNRDEDILQLAIHFIKQYNLEFKKNVTGLDTEVMNVLMNHDWPGNVRELRNVIERAMLYQKGQVISLEDISIMNAPQKRDDAIKKGDEIKTGKGIVILDILSGDFSLIETEKCIYNKALEVSGGVQSKAADLLGISRQRINYKLKSLGLLGD
jgi:two-component system, NtrC family, response regulator AtoC